MPRPAITFEELKEYSRLKKEIFRKGSFVEMDWSNPRDVRYNELAGKVLQLRNILLEHAA